MPDAAPNMLGGGGIKLATLKEAFDGPQHGWTAGFQHSAPSPAAIRKASGSILEEGPFDSEQLRAPMVRSASFSPGGAQFTFSATEPPEMEIRLSCTYVCPFSQTPKRPLRALREWDLIQSHADRGE